MITSSQRILSPRLLHANNIVKRASTDPPKTVNHIPWCHPRRSLNWHKACKRIQSLDTNVRRVSMPGIVSCLRFIFFFFFCIFKVFTGLEGVMTLMIFSTGEGLHYMEELMTKWLQDWITQCLVFSECPYEWMELWDMTYGLWIAFRDQSKRVWQLSLWSRLE